MHSLRRKWSQIVSVKQIATSFYATISDNPKLDDQTFCHTSVLEAEKVVGYPTSFLNLRWLLSDEVANVAVHLRKLLGTDHPLLDVAKDLILNNEKPSWGLLVLLVSKAGGHKKSFAAIDTDTTAGVLHSQRILAEVTEMIRVSNLLHKSIICIDVVTNNAMNMNSGNKIALLCGDYLLSNSYHQLACLKNHSLNELMSSALRDLTESEFIGTRDKQNNPLPGRPMPGRKTIHIADEFGVAPTKYKNVLGNAKPEWMLRNILGGASLLGKSCQGVLMLAGYDENFQKYGYLLGKYMALSLSVTKDYKAVYNIKKDISPVGAPVLFHIQRHPSFYSEFEKLIAEDGEVDQSKIRCELQDSPALNDTKLLQKELCERTLDILSKFKNCDAKTALTNIIFSMQL